jgi:hypothetical protein
METRLEVTMGYVFESDYTPTDDVKTFYVVNGLVKNENIRNFGLNRKEQYGYRSGPLSEQERVAIETLDRNGQWGDVATQIDALERIQRATTPGPAVRSYPFIVNDRDYTVFDSPTRTFSYDGKSIMGTPYKGFGAGRIISLTRGLGNFPSSGYLESEAAKMMRAIRPTRPDFDLTRFVGELRDAPRLLGWGNYSPRSTRDIGGGYLNYQFGIVPTTSDIQKMAEAVLKADELTKQFIQESSKLIHRRTSRILDEYTNEVKIRLDNGLRQYSKAGITLRIDHGSQITYTGLNAAFYLNARRRLSAFSSFEYFVGDPEGFTTRMDSYASKARKLLGGGLTASVAYELTPWSWMADWFVDIGGLLAYQQDVADYSLVARRSGYVVEDIYHTSVSLSPSEKAVGRGQITAVERIQRRRPGSPYSMSPNWDHSAYQWAILGALGLTRAPGIKFTRDTNKPT